MKLVTRPPTERPRSRVKPGQLADWTRAVSDSLESETAPDSLRLTRFLRRTGSHFAGKRFLAPHARAAGVQVAPNMRRKNSRCEDVGRWGATNRRRVAGLRGELALRAQLFARVAARAMTNQLRPRDRSITTPARGIAVARKFREYTACRSSLLARRESGSRSLPRVIDRRNSFRALRRDASVPP
jgi:hypothetical protein